MYLFIDIINGTCYVITLRYGHLLRREHEHIFDGILKDAQQSARAKVEKLLMKTNARCAALSNETE